MFTIQIPTVVFSLRQHTPVHYTDQHLNNNTLNHQTGLIHWNTAFVLYSVLDCSAGLLTYSIRDLDDFFRDLDDFFRDLFNWFDIFHSLHFFFSFVVRNFLGNNGSSGVQSCLPRTASPRQNKGLRSCLELFFFSFLCFY